MMSILTPKMVSNRFDNSANVVLCSFHTDASGTTISDQKTGRTYAPSGIAFTTPHAITENAQSTATAAVPKISGNIIFIDVANIANAGAVNEIRLGAISGRSLSMGQVGVLSAVDGTAGNSVAFQTLTAGQICTRCVTFSQSTGELRGYSRVGSSASQYDTTASNPTHVGDIEITAIVMAASLATPRYGFVLYEMDTLPTDAVLLAALDELYANWIAGIKVLPSGLA